jgi:hypothetical protein
MEITNSESSTKSHQPPSALSFPTRRSRRAKMPSSLFPKYNLREMISDLQRLPKKVKMDAQSEWLSFQKED